MRKQIVVLFILAVVFAAAHAQAIEPLTIYMTGSSDVDKSFAYMLSSIIEKTFGEGADTVAVETTHTKPQHKPIYLTIDVHVIGSTPSGNQYDSILIVYTIVINGVEQKRFTKIYDNPTAKKDGEEIGLDVGAIIVGYIGAWEE